MRSLWVRLHRYTGLALAGFLINAGLTGSLLAFHDELDAGLNPELFRVAQRQPALPPAELAARLEHADPRLKVSTLPLRIAPGATARLGIRPRLDPATGQPFPLDFDEVFVDPASGAVLGRRLWGACHFDRAHLLPCIYAFHYSLQLPGETGLWVMGGVGLVWLFATVVGIYLTFPATWKSRNGRAWGSRWRLAWTLKRGAKGPRRHLDLHRAGGLWLFPMMIALAVSGVSFNLRDAVFEPVLSWFSPLTPSPFDQRAARSELAEPTLPLTLILPLAKQEATRRDWTAPATTLFYNPAYDIYGVGFGNERDSGLGAAYLYFDGGDGHGLGAYQPSAGSAGDIFEALQLPLHSGRIAGLPGRIAVCITGLAVALISATGVLIWRDKRRGSP